MSPATENHCSNLCWACTCGSGAPIGLPAISIEPRPYSYSHVNAAMAMSTQLNSQPCPYSNGRVNAAPAILCPYSYSHVHTAKCTATPMPIQPRSCPGRTHHAVPVRQLMGIQGARSIRAKGGLQLAYVPGAAPDVEAHLLLYAVALGLAAAPCAPAHCSDESAP
jgi:hypothetical protein